MDESYVTRDEFNGLANRVGIIETQQARDGTRLDNVEKKLDKIESNTSWILRLIIGAIVLAVLGLIIKGGV